MITTPESPFAIGQAEVFYTKNPDLSQSVGIITTGVLAYNALMAAVELEKNNIGAGVLHIATIKPLDGEALGAFASNHDILITVEEHQVAGGLGSAVAEYLGEHMPKKIIRLGIHDMFGQSGEPNELLAHYGLDVSSIVAAARRALTP